ncbi:MAG TPA: ABC transporter ATP-binding protein, partial [Umezawaea sp.]
MDAPGAGEPVRENAVLLALRLYGRELRRHGFLSAGALVSPALGVTCQLYLAPLAVGALVGHLAGGGDTRLGAVLPYVLAFGGLMLLSEVLWRIGFHCLNRVDGRGIENLSAFAVDELLGKDAAFFHDNFAGSLTKRLLSFA